VGGFDIRLTRSAEPEFGRLDRETQKRFAGAIALLSESFGKPRTGPDTRPLKGLKGM
jgi:hypothetical protein